MTAKKKKQAKKKDPNKSKAAIAKKKNDAKKKAAKNRSGKQGDTVNSYCRELLLERKYTDEEICNKIQKKYPKGKFQLRYVGCKRWDLMHDGAKPIIERLIKHEGKLLPKSKVPKKAKVAKKKFTKDSDPLMKHAGINVHDKKKKVAKPRKLKKPVKKAIS